MLYKDVCGIMAGGGRRNYPIFHYVYAIYRVVKLDIYICTYIARYDRVLCHYVYARCIEMVVSMIVCNTYVHREYM